MNKLKTILLYINDTFPYNLYSKDFYHCLVVGGSWRDPTTETVFIEFGKNGRAYEFGIFTYGWTAKDDCNTIEYFSPTNGSKIEENKVISISRKSFGSKMTLMNGPSTIEYI